MKCIYIIKGMKSLLFSMERSPLCENHNIHVYMFQIDFKIDISFQWIIFSDILSIYD